MLRRSVEELTEKAHTPPPPPQPPRQTTFWPWIVTTAVLLLGVFGALRLLEDRAADRNGGPAPAEPSARTGPGTPGAPPSRPAPGPSSTSIQPPAGPAVATPERPRVAGRVHDAGGRPAGGARLALVSGPDPAAGCVLAEAEPNGDFQIEVPGAFPAFVTAWNDTAVSRPTPVSGPTAALAVALEPGTRLPGTLQAEGGLDPNGRRIMAVWSGTGRTASAPVRQGTFALTIPATVSVELHPFREGTSTFEWIPFAPLALGSGHREPLALRAGPAHLVLLRLQDAGRAVEREPRLIAAWQEGGGPTRFFSPVPGVAGAHHAALAPGSFRVAVWVAGYREILQEITVEEMTFAAIPLETSPHSLEGFFPAADPGQVWPETVAVRRDPELLPDAPAIHVPVQRDDGRAVFRAESLPWSSVVVEAARGPALQSEPISLPRSGVELRVVLDGTVAGVVQDAAGHPLPEVIVTAESAARRRHVATDPEGRYRIDRLAAGSLFVYPQTLAGRWEAVPLARNEHRLLLAPGATIERNFVLPGAAPVEIRVRDDDGRRVQGTLMIRTQGGTLVQAQDAAPADPGPPGEVAPIRLAPVVPGAYLLEVWENDVLYPLGTFSLPGALDLTVRRRQPRLILQPAWRGSGPAPDAPLRIALHRRHAQPFCRFELPRVGSLEIGGLEPGTYEVSAFLGGHHARGLAALGSAGAGSPTELVLAVR